MSPYRRMSYAVTSWRPISFRRSFSMSSSGKVTRKHVVLEYGVILRDQGDEISAGIKYREGEMASWVVEAGDPFDLGLLLKTAPQTISKRYALAFWDQFAEVFGIPMRIAKTDIRDKA